LFRLAKFLLEALNVYLHVHIYPMPPDKELAY
jgi:hypothetical protein